MRVVKEPVILAHLINYPFIILELFCLSESATKNLMWEI